jgi:hypothetical protein
MLGRIGWGERRVQQEKHWWMLRRRLNGIEKKNVDVSIML